MNTKIFAATCLLALSADAKSLRGLSSDRCTQLPSCMSTYSNGKMTMTNLDAVLAACQKSPTCVTSETKIIDSTAKGSCWTVFNGGTLTVGSGYTGKVIASKCGGSDVTSTLILASGSSPSQVTNEGGTVKAEKGSTIGKLETEGGTTTATGVTVDVVEVEGGSATVEAINAVTKFSVEGGSGELTAPSLGSASVEGGKGKIVTTGDVKTAELEGGTLTMTAATIGSLSLEGGSATISKAAVSKASTEGGSIDLVDGATVGTYKREGGSCTNCPAPSNSY